jgi:tetratricopeptide (TPR) repeat protein
MLNGQGAIDTALIHQWIDSAWNIQFVDPAGCMMLANQAITESHNQYYYGMLNGWQLRGEVYYTFGQLDSAILAYTQALQWSIAEKDDRETGNNYTGLASIFLNAGQRDSSLHYYQLGIALFTSLRDSSSLCDALLRYGNVHNAMGHLDLAIKEYMHSIRICEAIQREAYVGYNYGALGTIHDKQRNYSKAEEFFHKALAVFVSIEDVYGQMGTYNNLGILYKNQNYFDKSLSAYQQSLALADSIQFDRGQLSAHTNLGILYVQMGFFENALHHSKTGLEMAIAIEEKEPISDNLNWMARAQLGLHDYVNAYQNAHQALIIGEEVQSLEKQRDANLTLSDIYLAQGQYQQGLAYFKAYEAIKDSLYDIDKSKQISELQTIYETEKKDKEIQLLAKNAEIDLIRKTRLWIALGLSLLAGGALVYSQWIRRTRDRKILTQEKELEIQRRQTAELTAEKISRELDFKKQELVAKALQLARKNEFLQSLHEQVDKMQVHVEYRTPEVARHLGRQIQTDIESDEDWESFLASFREVHHDFIDHLLHTFPDISKSEIRLACLMKMNLSAKEQAALLNVTSDGIKKARYRLRKKMNLDSEIDLQAYFIGLS